jgi:hypothetical protein
MKDPYNLKLKPPVIEVAMAFAHALVAGEFAAARRMLTNSLQNETSVDELQENYDPMTSYWDGPPDTVKVGMVLPPHETNGIPEGIGWVFVNIDRHGSEGALLEGVGLLMTEEDSRFAIKHIQWGRP